MSCEAKIIGAQRVSCQNDPAVLTFFLSGDRDSDMEAQTRGAAPNLSSPYWSIALVALGTVGYFKGSPILASLPIDLTMVSGLVVALGIGMQILSRSRYDSVALARILLVFMTFLGGAAAEGSGVKATLLFTFTLACSLGPCFLLAHPDAQRWWLGANIATGGMMLVATLAFPDPYVRSAFGRLSLEGSNTIATSRVIGAGIIVAVILGVTLERWRVPLVLAALAGASVIVAVGSRGPILSIGAAMAAVLILAKVFGGRRSTAIGGGLAVATVAFWFLSQADSGGGGRVAAFLAGEEADESRGRLAHEALIRIPHHPFGLGWGGFGKLGFGGADTTLPYPHNMLLEVAVEGGWLALAAVVGFMLLALRGYIHSSTTPAGAALFGLGFYWVAVAQTSSDINGNRMTWIALSLGLVMRIKERESAKTFESQSIHPAAASI